MKQYLDILKDIKDNGAYKPAAREGMPATLSVFDKEIRITNGKLPILMGKKVLTKNVISELCWFLRGDTNIEYLHKYNNHIWDQDAYRYYLKLGGNNMTFEEFISKSGVQPILGDLSLLPSGYRYGDCGNIYGFQWRNQGDGNYLKLREGGKGNYDYRRTPVDQILQLIKGLIHDPYCRYHIVNAWNWQDSIENNQALPACHTFFQCNVRGEGKDKTLDISIWQRSCDMFLGVPYNLLSYGILHRLLCYITGYHIGDFVWHGGDCHIYENQMEAVDTYINRVETEGLCKNRTESAIDFKYWRPNIKDLGDVKDLIDNINVDDISILNYTPASFIAAPLSTGLNKD